MCAAVTSLPHSGHFKASWPRFASAAPPDCRLLDLDTIQTQLFDYKTQ